MFVIIIRVCYKISVRILLKIQFPVNSDDVCIVFKMYGRHFE